eukprot:2651248-Rhodomonas_salina.2
MWGVSCCALVSLLCVRSATGYFYSTDGHIPPFLHRTGSSTEVVQWDTGDLARDLALSHGVMVNYQGVYTLHIGMHVSVPLQHRKHGFACDEFKNALCLGANESTLVLPASGNIVVAADSNPQLPKRLLDAKNMSCGFSDMGYGRIVADVQRYDISACDVHSMTHTFFLYDETLYIIPIAFSPLLHFLLCVGAMFTLSGILYILKPEADSIGEHTAQQIDAKNGSLDVALGVTTISFLLTVASQAANNNFLSHEDVAGFGIACVAYVFYLASAVSTRLQGTPRAYEPGVTIDALITGVVVVCMGVYSTLQHPFNLVTTSLLLFRLWNKLLWFSFGGSYAPAPPYEIPYVVTRFTIDSTNLCFSIVYGWNQSFQGIAVAGLALVPSLLGTFIAAKYTFLLHTHMDVESDT